MNYDDYEDNYMRESMMMEMGMSGDVRYFRGPVDLEGRPVARTKQSHPYSYDGFVLWREGRNEEINGCIYTDRLDGWDPKKLDLLWEKHMKGSHWRKAEYGQVDGIENFLRDWNEDPKLRLIAVMEWCNQATGYPTWSLHFKSGKKESP